MATHGTRAARLAIGPLVLGLAGCEWPVLSPENTLPELTTLAGKAYLPSDYVVAAETVAPRRFRTMLTTFDGQGVAVGTITDDTGAFTINVPVNLLAPTPSLYEVLLIDPSHGPLYRAPIKLSAASTGTSIVVNAASTTIDLAAHRAIASGTDPAAWNFPALEQDPQIQTYALQYAHQLGVWSNASASVQAAPPAPSLPALSGVMAIAAKTP